MRIRRQARLRLARFATSFVCLWMTCAHPARADDATASRVYGFALNRFRLAPIGETFVAVPDALGAPRMSSGAVLDTARSMLQVDEPASGQSGWAYVHVQFALSIEDDWLVYGALPLVVAQAASATYAASTRTDLIHPSSLAVADGQLGLRWRFLSSEAWALAGALETYLPLGNPDELTGFEKVRLLPRIVASYCHKSRLHLSGSTGIELRPIIRFGRSTVGTEVPLELGAGYPITLSKRSSIQPVLEVQAALPTTDWRVSNAPVELGAGFVLQSGGWSLGAHVFTGLTEALGTPKARILTALSYSHAPPSF